MLKVTIIDRDTKRTIDSYVTAKQDEEYETELRQFRLGILRKWGIPFKWQEVETEPVV